MSAVIVGVVGYALIGAWVLGVLIGLSKDGDDHGPLWLHVLAAIIWPFTLALGAGWQATK